MPGAEHWHQDLDRWLRAQHQPSSPPASRWSTDWRFLSRFPTPPRSSLGRLACLPSPDTRAQSRATWVGDGLQGGRPASATDIERLSPSDASGIPAGLARCPDCLEFRGDYLALKGEGNGESAATGDRGPLRLPEPQPMRRLRRIPGGIPPQRLQLRGGNGIGLAPRRLCQA